MIDGLRFEVVTPAGRRRYLEVLARYILGEPAVDCWSLWANTTDADDLRWMDALAAADPRVRVLRLPSPVTHPTNFRIHKFFPLAADPHSVYLRLDDDIVFAAPGALAEVARRRVADPSPFLVYGNVLNSGLTSHLHQQLGRVSGAWGRTNYHCTETPAWNCPPFAVDLHRRFLADPSPEKWSLPDRVLADYERHSINVISWLGGDAAGWAGVMDADEELWLAVLAPRQKGRPNLALGNPLFCHFAFHSQREVVDRAADVLEGYRRLAGL